MPVYTASLSPTRSQQSRTVTWVPHPADRRCPCSGTLAIGKGGKKTTGYLVTEVLPDVKYGGGRAFQMSKADGTTYSVYLGFEPSCDCPGKTYEATDRADQRHGDRSESLGCCHLDALYHLTTNGHLPYPMERPEEPAERIEAETVEALTV